MIIAIIPSKQYIIINNQGSHDSHKKIKRNITEKN